jgi:hypothetical protein
VWLVRSRELLDVSRNTDARLRFTQGPGLKSLAKKNLGCFNGL